MLDESDEEQTSRNAKQMKRDTTILMDMTALFIRF